MEMDCTQTCPGAQVRHVQGVYFLTKCLSMHFIFRVIDSCLDIFKCTNNVQWSKLTTWLARSQKVEFWGKYRTLHSPHTPSVSACSSLCFPSSKGIQTRLLSTYGRQNPQTTPCFLFQPGYIALHKLILLPI